MNAWFDPYAFKSFMFVIPYYLIAGFIVGQIFKRISEPVMKYAGRDLNRFAIELYVYWGTAIYIALRIPEVYFTTGSVPPGGIATPFFLHGIFYFGIVISFRLHDILSYLKDRA